MRDATVRADRRSPKNRGAPRRRPVKRQEKKAACPGGRSAPEKSPGALRPCSSARHSARACVTGLKATIEIRHKKSRQARGPERSPKKPGSALAVQKSGQLVVCPKKAVCGVRCRSTAPKKPGAVLKRPLGETPRKKTSDATGQRAPKKPGARWLCRKSRHWKNAERKARRLNVRSSRHGPCKKARNGRAAGNRVSRPRSAIGFCQ